MNNYSRAAVESAGHLPGWEKKCEGEKQTPVYLAISLRWQFPGLNCVLCKLKHSSPYIKYAYPNLCDLNLDFLEFHLTTFPQVSSYCGQTVLQCKWLPVCCRNRRLGGTEVERGRGVGSGPSTLSDEHLSLRKHTKLSSTRGHMPCRLEHCCSPQRAPSHPTPHLTRVYEIKRLRHSPWKLFPSFTECSSLNRIFEVPHAPSGFGFTLGKMMFRESHRKVFHAPKMFALM